MEDFKQNVPYTKDGVAIKLQFEFCPKCKYFDDCYNPTGPHYLNQECIDDFYNGVYDDDNVNTNATSDGESGACSSYLEGLCKDTGKPCDFCASECMKGGE